MSTPTEAQREVWRHAAGGVNVSLRQHREAFSRRTLLALLDALDAAEESRDKWREEALRARAEGFGDGVAWADGVGRP